MKSVPIIVLFFLVTRLAFGQQGDVNLAGEKTLSYDTNYVLSFKQDYLLVRLIFEQKI